MKKIQKRLDKELANNSAVERIPPQNVQAEMAVLGSMLIEENAISIAVENLRHEDFYKDAHKKIYAAVVELYDARKAVDLITLVEKLKNEGSLDMVGGASYLAGLTNVVPTAANVNHYVQIVKEKNILRMLINNATQIVADAFGAEEQVEDVLDRAEKLIFDIAERHVGEANLVPIKELVKDSMEMIDKLYQQKTHVTGIETGFTDFDIVTAGLQPSDLIVVAGRPSMGKSALAINIMEHAAIVNKVPTAFFSLEMSKEQLVQRLLCSIAKVDGRRLRTGFLSADDWNRLPNAANELSKAPIFIDDSSNITVLELRAKARRLKSHFDIKLIVVDYLQLMRGIAGSESRQQEISEISRSLKGLARELRVPVIGISQLSRAVESREDHRPQLSDLRESGAIEQDADVVVLLMRPEYYGQTEENKGIAEVNIAKQRNGPTKNIKLAFIKEFTRFENLATIGEQEFA